MVNQVALLYLWIYGCNLPTFGLQNYALVSIHFAFAGGRRHSHREGAVALAWAFPKAGDHRPGKAQARATDPRRGLDGRTRWSEFGWVDQMEGKESRSMGGSLASTSSLGKSSRSSIWLKKLPQSISSIMLWPDILSLLAFGIFFPPRSLLPFFSPYENKRAGNREKRRKNFLPPSRPRLGLAAPRLGRGATAVWQSPVRACSPRSGGRRDPHPRSGLLGPPNNSPGVGEGCGLEKAQARATAPSRQLWRRPPTRAMQLLPLPRRSRPPQRCRAPLTHIVKSPPPTSRHRRRDARIRRFAYLPCTPGPPPSLPHRRFADPQSRKLAK
ncbi:hypothetical protein NL676_019453 [Syzygium grande]|nr:hypothetical protein NL676_019453 [Syzygium grande]